MPPFDPACAADYPAVIGCDEVGRGALCGPVVVAAVWFDPTAIPPDLLARLDDSKRVKEPLREILTPLIRAQGRVAVAAGSRALIDRVNVRVATLDAMRRAVLRLALDAPVLVDGRDAVPGLPQPCRAVVGGDRAVPQIAAASIVAKTFRDALMRVLARRHPHYGWDRNVGYGAPVHLAGLRTHGRTPHHRLSFTRAYGDGGSRTGVADGDRRAPFPPPSAGEGGPRVSEGRERGATVPDAALPSPDPLRGPPSPAEGGGRTRRVRSQGV